jgi:hypothetical protein
MSGITAIFREWLATFYPTAVEPRRVFQACLWTCFFLAAIVLVIRQQLVIIGLEGRIDQSGAIKAESKRRHGVFGKFMEEGEALAKELREIHGEQFQGWEKQRKVWREQVCATLTEMGVSTEAAAFRHAGERDPKPAPGTVIDDRYLHKLYGEQLEGNRGELKAIVQRLLNK